MGLITRKIKHRIRVSNHEDLRFIADQFGIPFYVWSIAPDKSNREQVEREEMELLKRERISFMVLARYMQVISDEMIERYPHHIINIHHSFLPSSTSTTPSCRPSSGRSPTTRPTSAA